MAAAASWIVEFEEADCEDNFVPEEGRLRYILLMIDLPAKKLRVISETGNPDG